MALRINTNVAALNAHKNMINTDSLLSSSLERLSTGLRINKAADDSSGMAIADSLKAQHLGIGQAIKNANDGISIVQTADGALQESINIINTIKTKAIQAASDGQTTVTRTAIQNDINKLMEELSVIAKTTSYNGQKLLSGAFTNKSFQIGAYANETAALSIGSTEATKMGHITQANLSLASESGGEVQLTITSSITGEQLTLNKIDIQSNNDAANGMGALADEVNRYAALTGISATAIINTTSGTAIQAGTTGSGFAVNGVNIGAITVAANDGDGALVKAINGKTAEHGVTAAINEDGTLTLTSSDGRSIAVTGSISDVFGSTSSQMSTQGYLALTQKGVSQFQINGIGAGATGDDIVISADMETVADSVIASGSTIGAGSMFATGTIVGGDAMVESSISSTQLDYELKAGSTLYSFTQVAKGSVLGGSVTIAGDTSAAATQIEQDMLLKAGSTLKSGSILGVGTVITTAFTASSVDYAVGDTLTSSVTLDADVTLAADMELKYSSTAADNSRIKANSTFTAGSVMGKEFEIGATYSSATTGSQAITLSTATTTDLYIKGGLTLSNSVGGLNIEAGSLMGDGSTITLTTSAGDSTWSGPTLILASGALEQGDSIVGLGTITLSGDQVLSESLDSTLTSLNVSSGAFTLGAGSYMKAGFVTNSATVAVGVSSAYVATLTTATLADDMTLRAGSELSAGSLLLSGSELGDNTYVMGGPLQDDAANLSTYARTELAAGSKIQSGSTMAEGSTIGGTTTVSTGVNLDSDMTLTAGTQLAFGTKLESGTVLNQDMSLANIASNGATFTLYNLKAGDVLTTDLYVAGTTGATNQAGTTLITLSESMTLKADSDLAAGSVLAINTTNSGSVGLSDTQSYKLSDLNVLTSEGAQRAIDIAEAALQDLDNTRSGLGSVQNQLVSTISNLSVTKTNIQASESAIRDVDFAEEASTFSKLQLLAQTGSYALAQANAASQNVLSLLQ